MQESEIRALGVNGTFLGKGLHGVFEETHISWVILTTRFVFKIKKPVKLSFLDFSTLSKRKKYCEREVLLNRRFSDIYLDVVPVRRQQGAWRLGSGAGKIVDYAVRMKRMKSSRRMDLMLQAGMVGQSDIRSIAESIASFQAQAKMIFSPFDRVFTLDNFNDIRTIGPFLEDKLGKSYHHIVSRSVAWNDSFLFDHAKRFQQRVELGFKRDGHGDLHSGNIFLFKRPVIFDCIEFDDAYRQIDVLDEVAFFCMDLEFYGKKMFAEVFMNDYERLFPALGTPEDKAIFVYYKCYRANVRAKVSTLAAMQEDDPVAVRRHLRSIRKYLRLIERYMA